MRLRTTATLLVLPLALSAVAAGVADELTVTAVPAGCYVAIENDVETTEDDVLACELATFLHGSTTKLSNLSDADAQPAVGYDENAPTTSVTAGGGAGAASIGAGRNADGTGSSLVVEGTFTGPIDVMEFDLHLISPGALVQTTDDIDLSIEIDGIELLSYGTQRIVNVRPAPNATSPATNQLDFAITNMAAFMQLAGMDLSPDAVHTVTVRTQGWFVDSGNWAWVFDTTEVPSSIIFNPLEIDEASAVIRAF